MTRNVEELFGGVVTAPHQIPFTYKSSVGGETFFSLPFYPVTGVITINGGMQVPLDNFEIDGNTLNLGRALSKGDVVYCLFDKILSPEDTAKGIRIYKFQAVGGETEFTPDFTSYGVQSLYIGGEYKTPDIEYSYNSTTGKVSLQTALTAGVWVVAEISVKQPNISPAFDRSIQEIARSANVKDSEVILSTDTSQVLNGKKVIFDVVTQHIYGLPTLPTNVYISSVSGGQLTYNPGSVVVSLLPVPSDVRDDFTAYKDAMLADGGELVNSGLSAVASSVKRNIDSHFKDYYNVKDFGAIGDGVTDDTDAIQLAVAYLGDLTTRTMFARPSVLFFPDGDYLTSKPIILWDGVSLRGASQSTTRIKMTSATNTTGVTTNSPVRNLPRDVNCILAVFSSVAGYPYRTAISDIQLYGIEGDIGVTAGKVINAIYAPEAAFLTVDRVRTWYTNYGIMSYNLWMSSFRDLDLREHAEWGFLLSNDGSGAGGSTSISLERVYGHTCEGGIKLYGANYSTLTSCGVDSAGISDPTAADTAAKAPYVFESCQGLVASSLGAESIYTRRCIFIIGGHVTLNEPDLYAWRGTVTGRRMYGIHVTTNGNLVLNGGRLWGIQFSAASATECFAVVQSDGINGSVQCNGSLISDASVDSGGVAIGNIFYGTRTYRGRTIQQEAGVSRYQTNTLTLNANVTTGDLFSSGLDTTRYTVIDAVAQMHSTSPTLDQAKLHVQVMNVSANSARIWIINPDGSANFTAQPLRVTFTYRVN